MFFGVKFGESNLELSFSPLSPESFYFSLKINAAEIGKEGANLFDRCFAKFLHVLPPSP